MKKRLGQIELFKTHPIEVQQELLQKLIYNGAYTEFGKQYHFLKMESYEDFKENVPLQEYEQVKPYVDRLMKGEQNLLWSTEAKWFAKSSGTTSARSKFIPVTRESLEECHYSGGKDLLAMYYNTYENRKLYNGKHLIVGGSAQINHLFNNSYFGDLSAIIVKNLPWWAEIRRTPSREITLMSEWEEKIEKMAQTTIHDDVYIIAGVPSWTMVLAKRVLEITGKKTLKEVWPNLELYMHGGVSFEPYRQEFKRIFGFDDMHYVESYNASEGFFGIQDDPNKEGMLLMLDYGIFYEFIPMKHFKGINSTDIIPLQEVKLNVEYALVISTNAGLWRYIIGDTITFTETVPYRFKITGRTKSYINTFGEEVNVGNAEMAIAKASMETNAQVRDFHACPIYMQSAEKGGHEWLIEFLREPEDFEKFQKVLDEALRELNSDYDAKRYNSMILEFPKIHKLEPGTFDKWLKSKNKLGGQNKIPRLANNREILEQILPLMQVHV